jgi:hypothetical protein
LLFSMSGPLSAQARIASTAGSNSA